MAPARGVRARRVAAAACLALASCRVALGDDDLARLDYVEEFSRRGYTKLSDREDAPIIARYLETCRALQVQPSADAIVALELGSTHLAPHNAGDQSFGDLEMRALVMLLEDEDGVKLKELRHLDFSACTLGSAGVLLVIHLLHHPQCNLEVLDLSNQFVSAENMRYLVAAVRSLGTLRRIRLHSCHLGDAGGELVLGLLHAGGANSSVNGNASGGATGSAPILSRIDLENNYISFKVCSRLAKEAKALGVKVNLNGNRVLDEIYNSVSHGMGEIMAVVGTVLLARKMGCDKPAFQMWSMGLYCTALNMLYLSSTLYHAFFALGRTTVYVFSILDYSGIFILIAGSYSSFLGVLFYEEWWATLLLAMMWLCAIVGIGTAAFYTGQYAMHVRVSLYIAMGWAVLICIRPMARRLGYAGTCFLFTGGVLYTGGVPWFVRGHHTGGIPDHTIWHLFVLAGSLSHFLCVYWYVLTDKARGMLVGPDGDEDDVATQYMSVPLHPL